MSLNVLSNFFVTRLGSRYVSWLPNFSVEVTHINTVLRTGGGPLATLNAGAAHTSQVRNMARQVQQMFPRYPISTIIADLQLSRSMEITIDNILEGRLQVPARFQGFDDEAEFGDVNAGGGGADGGSSSSEYSSTASTSSSLDSGYEIERNSNIFGNQNELLRDER